MAGEDQARINTKWTKRILSYGSSPTELPLMQATTHVSQHALKYICLGTLYIISSAGMILYNKYLLHHDRFPFPVALTTMHMGAAFLVGSVLYRIRPTFFPSAPALLKYTNDAENQQQGFLYNFAPIGFCGAVSLVCGNTAYEFASVSFLQMIKEGNIVLIYTMMVFFGLDTFKFAHALVLVFVAASASYATSGAIVFTWQGLALQLMSGFGQSLQVVLTNRLMSGNRGLKIDAMTMVLCTAPMMLLVLLPLNMYYWREDLPTRFMTHSSSLLANVALALALQVISMVTVREISATGHALASLLKDIGIVFGAALVLHEVITRTQLIGFTLSVTGILIYSILKVCPQWLPIAQASS